MVTQRSGNLYRLNVFNKNIFKIKGAPKVYNLGQGGLLDIAFEKENNVQRVYLCLSKVIPSNKSSTAIHSYNFKNNKLTNEKDSIEHKLLEKRELLSGINENESF